MTPFLMAGLLGQAAPSRFLAVAPLPSLPVVSVDMRWCQGGFAHEECRRQGLQGRVLWIDGTANLDRLGSDASVRALLEKIAGAGFNTVVLDVKPIVGRTLYPSQLTSQLTSWKGKSIPPGYDPVAAFRRETSRLGVSFLVSLNAFSEGHSYARRDEGKADSQFGDPGWGYRHPELQSVLYLQKPGQPRFVRTGQSQDQIPLMMNPHASQVQERVLSFVREVCLRYRPDGLLFDDRFRYHGLDSDFSDEARQAFQKFVRREVSWPTDVYTVTEGAEGKTGIRPGLLFDAWLAWRAQTLSEFAGRVRQEISKTSPQTLFGIYAGSWYGDYARYGSNYGSTALQAGFPFLTRSYRATGMAPKLDLLVTGCYYRTGTMEQAMEEGLPIGQTVEAAGDVSNRVAGDQCWVYAGVQLADFKGDTRLLGRALQAACATTQGVMVFDLSHDMDSYWPLFAKAFARRAEPPHAQREALARARRSEADWRAKGRPEPPFPILPGAPGSGF